MRLVDCLLAGGDAYINPTPHTPECIFHMLNCFVCAKEHEEGFKVCPFCRVRFCGDCKGDTNLERHKLLHRCIRRDMPLVTVEATEGMCAQVAEEEAKGVCEENLEEFRQGGAPLQDSKEADPLESEGAGPSASEAANLPVEYCVVCGQETNMKCKSCKAIFVCSRACQRKVWPAHMEECAGKFVFDDFLSLWDADKISVDVGLICPFLESLYKGSYLFQFDSCFCCFRPCA